MSGVLARDALHSNDVRQAGPSLQALYHPGACRNKGAAAGQTSMCFFKGIHNRRVVRDLAEGRPCKLCNNLLNLLVIAFVVFPQRDKIVGAVPDKALGNGLAGIKGIKRNQRGRRIQPFRKRQKDLGFARFVSHNTLSQCQPAARRESAGNVRGGTARTDGQRNGALSCRQSQYDVCVFFGGRKDSPGRCRKHAGKPSSKRSASIDMNTRPT